MKPAKGKFKRKQKMGGNAEIIAMRRAHITVGYPSLCPSKNRLVEAIIIHLTAKHTSSSTITSPGNKRSNESRWKKCIQEYKYVQARVSNSDLKHTLKMYLFNVNETTLMHWHKRTARRDEASLLLQGRSLPGNVTKSSKVMIPTTMKSNPNAGTRMAFTLPINTSGKQKPSSQPKSTDQPKPPPP